MYNLNVNVATTLPVSFLNFDGQCNTPRTPEIVNSLVAMTNPFDALMKSTRENDGSPGSEESYSGTVSPLGSPNSSPPSVQHTRSQLIKEGLKLTIQTKRKHSGSETKEEFEEFESKRVKREELTEEDEERRKRRRERNKIAATKCRMKKREKTANLVNESELLESQNIDLKTQIQDLQKQKRKLIDMLSMHLATCVKQPSSNIQSNAFQDDFPEAYGTTFDGHSNFCGETSRGDFHVANGQTEKGLNPYGKDPNFAKMLDEVTPGGGPGATPAAAPTPAPSAAYSRAFDKPFPSSAPCANSSALTNYYQSKTRVNVDNSNEKVGGSRSCYDFDSDKKREKDKELSRRSDGKKCSSPFDSKDSGVFRSNFQCTYHNDDADSYKPNGIVDGNFFASKSDVFTTANDYGTAFGNPLDNGCMA